ncbi:uncharacterized protein [Lepisosteus oculatus]|uniref:uncharacterized protein isoform X2 n=1 Tax=Lepisosteus oculatus TaxID=7918 RepID=UPI0037140513
MLWNPFRSVPKDGDDKDVTSGHLDKSSVKTASEESVFHSKQIGVNSGIPINPFYSWPKEKDSEDLAAESCEKINSEKTGRDESLFHSKQIGVNGEILWNPFYSWSKDNEVVTLESLGKMSSGKTSSAEKLSQTKQDGDVGEMVRNPFLSALKEMGRESVAPEPCETLRSEEPAGKGKRGSSDWLSGFQREVPSNPFYTSPKAQGQADLESWRDVQARKSLSDSALIAPEPAGPSLVLPRVLPAPVQERRWSRVETEAPLYESIILIGQERSADGFPVEDPPESPAEPPVTDRKQSRKFSKKSRKASMKSLKSKERSVDGFSVEEPPESPAEPPVTDRKQSRKFSKKSRKASMKSLKSKNEKDQPQGVVNPYGSEYMEQNKGACALTGDEFSLLTYNKETLLEDSWPEQNPDSLVDAGPADRKQGSGKKKGGTPKNFLSRLSISGKKQDKKKTEWEEGEAEPGEAEVSFEDNGAKQKRVKRLKAPLFAHRRGSKSKHEPAEDLRSDCNISEAAPVESWGAQADDSQLCGFDKELQGACKLDEEEEEEAEDEGDTDSLMEWWSTVEQWDEIPDDEETLTEEGEAMALANTTVKVQKGIRLFNKLFIERAEGLWQHISYLNALADDIDKFHRKAKIAAITGGTTSAVGGVATITGLVLAPLTLGTSLVVTAVGLGVVAAGGIASTTATISDTVHNSQDRKKAEKIVEDYQKKMVDLSHSLRFIHQGIGSLQKYDIVRFASSSYGRRVPRPHHPCEGSGRASEVFPSHAAHVRQAARMADAASSAARAVQIAAGATGLLASLFVGMDVYFVAKDKRDLKHGDKSEYAAKVREATGQLHSGLIELNAIREELQSIIDPI